ncbi:uracil phosphoribosyltransferase [Micromonospora sp. BRA006-A]|nr:uracil phosphoribosyltransferase [Micromonospora sp. BRA006-A]
MQTPVTATEGSRLANPPLLVPVLRAGLGMADAALGLLPESSMGFVGLARDEETYEPRAYMESLPRDLSGLPVLVLDPMLATGGSLEHCCRRSPTVAAPTSPCCACWPRRSASSGWALRPAAAPGHRSIDEGLNDSKFIVPGLGDAGDRRSAACSSGVGPVRRDALRTVDRPTRRVDARGWR